MSELLPPEDYLDFFAFDTVIYGGQAVNIWAEYYLSLNSDIQKHQPFLSKDLDLVSNSLIIEKLKNQLSSKGWTFSKPKGRSGFLLGRFIYKDFNREVEVTSRIPNFDADIESHSIELIFKKTTVRVLTPVALFTIKHHNLKSLSQLNRQDKKHLEILIPCIKLFITEMISNNLDAKHILRNLQHLLKAITKESDLKFKSKYGNCFKKLIPIDLLLSSKNEKFSNFASKGLPKAWEKYCSI